MFEAVTVPSLMMMSSIVSQESLARTRQTDRQAGRQADRQTDRQAGRQTDRQTDRQTGRQEGRQADRQTDRQRLFYVNVLLTSKQASSDLLWH